MWLQPSISFGSTPWICFASLTGLLLSNADGQQSRQHCQQEKTWGPHARVMASEAMQRLMILRCLCHRMEDESIQKTLYHIAWNQWHLFQRRQNGEQNAVEQSLGTWIGCFVHWHIVNSILYSEGIRTFKPLCGQRGPRTLGEMGDSSVSDMTPLSPCRTVPNNKSMHASPHAALTHSLDVTAKVQVLASNSTARSLSWQLASRRLTEPTLNNTTGWRFLIVWAEHVSKPHWVSLVEASWI